MSSIKKVLSTTELDSLVNVGESIEVEYNTEAPIFLIRSDTHISNENQNLIELKILEEFKKNKLKDLNPFKLTDVL
jgi:hypothetical protein